jgi:glucokinase
MYYIGVDIGGMSIKAGLVTEDGKIVLADSCVTNASGHYSEIVKDTAALCLKIIDKKGLTVKDIGAIGVGIPGTIDAEKGTIVYSNNINFKKVPFVKEFKKHINIPIFIGNDANCAALGEVKFGSAKGVPNIVFVTLGTGVGTGFVMDNKIFAGKGGAGAEGGHMVVRAKGEKCTCGRRGCWEAYASATALLRLTKKAIEKNPTSQMADIAKMDGCIKGNTSFDAAKAGDKAALKVVNEYVEYISEGLANLVNIFRPDVAIIGGGVSAQGDYLIDKIQKSVYKKSYGGKVKPEVIVKQAGLGNDAGILGAAALCLE